VERELSAQKAIVQQLTSTMVDLQEALKEEKEMSEKMKKKINQFQTELEKEKEKTNLDKSESSNSPPLMKN
jgi:predicted RNase H-like nuclease (RuvC/YqgF family)